MSGSGFSLVGSRSDYETILLYKARTEFPTYTKFYCVAAVFYTYYLILLEILVEKRTHLSIFSYAVKDDKGE